MSEYFAESLARPLGLDFQVGLRDRALLRRVAQLNVPDPRVRDTGSPMTQRAWESVELDWDSWAYMSAENPGSNGFGTARSIARAGAVLAMKGTLDGVEHVRRDVAEEVCREQVYANCEPFGPVRWGLGFGLHTEEYPAPSSSCFHWGGYGGSSVVMDQETGVSFAYACNELRFEQTMYDDPRVQRLWTALSEVLALLD